MKNCFANASQNEECELLFSILQGNFHSSFFILHSSFFIFHSSFFILHSSFFILHFSFFILHS